MGNVSKVLHRCRGIQRLAAFLIAVAMIISMVPANNLILHAEDNSPNNGVTVKHSNITFKIGGAGGDLDFSVDGGTTKYRVGNNEVVNSALENYAVKGGSSIIVYALPKPNDTVTGFDCKYSGKGYFFGDNANELREQAKGDLISEDGYEIVIPQNEGELDGQGVEIAVDFGQDNQNGNQNQGPKTNLSFNVGGASAGNVYFAIAGTCEKTQYIDNDTDVMNILNEYSLSKDDQITLWLEPNETNEIGHFQCMINGNGILPNQPQSDDDIAKVDAAKAAACSVDGYKVTIDEQGVGGSLEFNVEFRSKENNNNNNNNNNNPPGPGPNNNQPQAGVSWNTFDNKENLVKKIAYKINDAAQWTELGIEEMHNIISLKDNDDITIKFIMEEHYAISSEGISIRYHQDADGQHHGYQNDAISNFSDNGKEALRAEVAEALTSEEGYTFKFNPTSIKDADGVSLYDTDQTTLRIQFNVTKVYATKNSVNIFIQNEVGKTSDGRIIYGETIENGKIIVEGTAPNSEIEFELNGNRYGGQGIVGQTHNDGSISIKYPSALDGKLGEMVSFMPDEYIHFDTFGDIDSEGKNSFMISDELMDELYIDYNNDFVFEANEKVPLGIGEDGRARYEEILNGAERYNIFIRKHRSPNSTLSWDYANKDSDAYVDHGKVYIKKIVRGDKVLVDNLHMNDDGSVALNGEGKPVYDTIRDEDVKLSLEKNGCTVWAKNGDIVTLMLIPTYGYQLSGVSVNGGDIAPLAEQSTFEIVLNGNLHFGGSFVKSEDVTKINTSVVSGASIKNGENATDTGNLSLTVDKNNGYTKNAATAVDVEKGQVAESILSLDLKLDNIVSKGKEGDYWTSNITEFDKNIDVDVKLKDIKVNDGEEITIVRDHNGKLEELECSFNSKTGTISFPTNKFSTYTVVKKSKPNKTVAVTKLAIAPKSVSFTAKGETKALKVTISPKDATNKEVTWSSSNTSVVKVDANGKLTAVANGTAVITVKSKSNPKITAKCDVTVKIPNKTVAAKVDVSYKTHVQSIGWQKYVSNGAMAGTSGIAKRLEGINIKVSGNKNLGIQYTTHVQSYGWLPWSANDEMSGTEGEAKRLEAIKIQLTGADKDLYDVYYRVHAQSYGWLNWAKNGAPAGTAGLAKRLEAIQIIVVKNGEKLDTTIGGIKSANDKAYITKSGMSQNADVYGTDVPNVKYKTHVQTFGWQGWKYNGGVSGTVGLAKRLEGINIELTNSNYSGGIQYQTHIQSIGWEKSWKKNGQMSGTSGMAKRLEAIRIELTGDMAKHYDVYYRVHAQSFGWLGWAKNGESAGTEGLAKRLEGIQIVLVKKGDKAPAANYGGISAKNPKPFIKK